MSRSRSLRRALALVAAVVAAGCGEGPSPTEPVAPPPSASLLGDLVGTTTGLLTTVVSTVTSAVGSLLAPVLGRSAPLDDDIVVYGTVWPGLTESASTTIRVPEAGLSVVFPYNAVKTPLRVKITAHRGDLVAYSFEPHGVTFHAPIQVRQDLRYTSAYYDSELRRKLVGGYLANGLADIDADGIATMSEAFPIYYSPSSPSVARFNTNHFSGYIIATGRMDHE